MAGPGQRGRPKKVVSQVQTNDLFANIAAQLKKQAKTPNVYGYIPLPKQEAFHGSHAHIRLYIGGNRSGKTTAGTVEDIYYLRGEHPFKKVPEPPVFGRIVATSFNEGVKEIIIPKLQQWVPPSLLINGSWEDSYRAGERKLYLENGSTCELMSYDQDQQKFAGTSRHFIHFDEEPPYDIYTECMARLIDTEGDAWLTLTPLDGMTWIYDTLYVPGSEGSEIINVVEASIHENTNLSTQAIQLYLDTVTDPDEKQARIAGKFIQLGGRVYKEYDPGTDDNPGKHIIENFELPKSWDFHASMDHGLNNPTAWLFHGISPTGEVVTFWEHYANEMTVAEHAKVVLDACKALGRMPSLFIGDPSIAQRNAITMTSVQIEYSIHGIPIGLANNDVVVGINKVKSYLRDDPNTKRPRWKHTPNCVMLKKEMSRLRWKTYASKKMQHDMNPYEEVHKKGDHCPDALRYEFSIMPDLTPEKASLPTIEIPVPSPTHNIDRPVAEHYFASRGWQVEQVPTSWEFNGDYSDIAAFEAD